MEPTRPVVFQILPSLVVGGAERLVVHLVAHLSRERFAPVCVCLESPLGTHYEARARRFIFWARAQGRAGACCANSARCFGSTALRSCIRTSWAELRLPADAALSHACAGAYRA
jgi:hypothetical protein